jgi:hypothetical protein
MKNPSELVFYKRDYISANGASGYEPMVTTRETFLSDMREIEYMPRHYHEIIFGGRPWPVKFFLDVEVEPKDIGNRDITKEDAKKYNERIDQFMRCATALAATLGVGHMFTGPLVYDASRIALGNRDVTATKYSVHLIFPDAWFDCVASLLVFIHMLKFEVDKQYGAETLPKIDMAVYREHTFSMLRLPFCSKASDPNRKLLPRVSDGLNVYNRALFLRSCVSVSITGWPKDTKEFICMTSTETAVATAAVKKKPIVLCDEQVIEAGIERIMAYIELKYGGFDYKKPEIFANGKWRVYCLRSISCELSSNSTGHGSNNMYICSEPPPLGQVYFECLDPDCKKYRTYLTENFSHFYRTLHV